MFLEREISPAPETTKPSRRRVEVSARISDDTCRPVRAYWRVGRRRQCRCFRRLAPAAPVVEPTAAALWANDLLIALLSDAAVESVSVRNELSGELTAKRGPCGRYVGGSASARILRDCERAMIGA